MLILPGRSAKGQRPSGPVLLNHESPRAQGLGVWVPDGLWDYVRNVGPVQRTAPSLIGLPTIGQARRFAEASSNYIDFPHVPWLDTCAAASFAFWQANAQATAGRYGHRLAQQTVWVGNNSGFSIFEFNGSADVLAFAFRNTGTESPTFSGFSGGPHRVVVTYAAGTLSVYRNGQLVGTSTSATASLPSTSEYFSIGRGNGSSPAYYASADLADICAWSRVLTPAEVWADYDPATRWDLYWQRRRTFFIPAGGGGSFNPAWAAGSNVILGATPC